MSLSIKELKEKLAIVILAYADYESLELALASHAKFSADSGVHIFVLQNGRGSYDCERTYAVGKRYHQLYPKTIDVIDDIQPGIPYYSLKTLFKSERFKKYEYIIKLDDDVLVLTEDWVDKLCKCYIESSEKYGDDLSYVTSLVNNNPYGFKKIIELSNDLKQEYFDTIAREHLVGCTPNDPYAPYRIIPKEEICSGSNGTIWGYPYICRWLHRKTTLVPQEYINFSRQLPYDEVNSKDRYSINCMLFKKELWEIIYDGGSDDEHMCHAYCLKYNKKIIADLSIPMVHLFFFSQRNECKDMIDEMRVVYTDFLKLNFPITICNNRLIEIENRLRAIENAKQAVVGVGGGGNPAVRGDLPFLSRKIIGGIICFHDHGLKYTIKRLFQKIFG
ncbi:MAG: hypothetical protein MJ050_03765 [Phascolarctobacterium sp.]|nr:hypothetical protein [Phascolarctobacterium sp.]